MCIEPPSPLSSPLTTSNTCRSWWSALFPTRTRVGPNRSRHNYSPLFRSLLLPSQTGEKTNMCPSTIEEVNNVPLILPLTRHQIVQHRRCQRERLTSTSKAIPDLPLPP